MPGDPLQLSYRTLRCAFYRLFFLSSPATFFPRSAVTQLTSQCAWSSFEPISVEQVRVPLSPYFFYSFLPSHPPSLTHAHTHSFPSPPSSLSPSNSHSSTTTLDTLSRELNSLAYSLIHKHIVQSHGYIATTRITSSS